MKIRRGSIDEAEVVAMLQAHRASMSAHSPPESIHALSLEDLASPRICLWCAWESGELLGCGALKEIADDHGEIKSMRTAAAHLRKGVASAILERIIQVGIDRGYRRLSLETGSADAFEPARKLYAHFGFRFCGPFGDYIDDPYSVFMTKRLRLRSTRSQPT